MRSLFLRWLPVLLGLVAYDVYLLGYRLAEVQGNVEAQFIIITPGLLASHLAHRRRQDRQHAEQVGRQEAHAAELAAHRQEMKAVVEKVGELHDLSIEGRLPERILKP